MEGKDMSLRFCHFLNDTIDLPTTVSPSPKYTKNLTFSVVLGRDLRKKNRAGTRR